MKCLVSLLRACQRHLLSGACVFCSTPRSVNILRARTCDDTVCHLLPLACVTVPSTIWHTQWAVELLLIFFVLDEGFDELMVVLIEVWSVL